MPDPHATPERDAVGSASGFTQGDCPENVHKVSMTPAEMMRFFDKVSFSARPRSCWDWVGSIDKWGYALMRVDGKTRVVHKVIYEHFYGSVADGMELDHRCKNSSCVNPAHLEQVTHSENILRGDYRRDRAATGEFMPMGRPPRVARPVQPRTHCQRGHEWTPENTQIGADGARRCRECRNARRRRGHSMDVSRTPYAAKRLQEPR